MLYRGPLNGAASPPNGIRWPYVGRRAVRPHLATPPAPERVRLLSRRRTAHGGERSVGRLVIVARSGSRGWRLGFGIRAGRRRTRALLTRAAAEHAPGDATCPRAYAPSVPTQGSLWCRAQRRPPRDCREIRVTGLYSTIRMIPMIHVHLCTTAPRTEHSVPREKEQRS